MGVGGGKMPVVAYMCASSGKTNQTTGVERQVWRQAVAVKYAVERCARAQRPRNILPQSHGWVKAAVYAWHTIRGQ